jgi:hypothetical protein
MIFCYHGMPLGLQVATSADTCTDSTDSQSSKLNLLTSKHISLEGSSQGGPVGVLESVLGVSLEVTSVHPCIWQSLC